MTARLPQFRLARVALKLMTAHPHAAVEANRGDDGILIRATSWSGNASAQPARMAYDAWMMYGRGFWRSRMWVLRTVLRPRYPLIQRPSIGPTIALTTEPPT